jgi:hypothetical protein
MPEPYNSQRRILNLALTGIHLRNDFSRADIPDLEDTHDDFRAVLESIRNDRHPVHERNRQLESVACYLSGIYYDHRHVDSFGQLGRFLWTDIPLPISVSQQTEIRNKYQDTIRTYKTEILESLKYGSKQLEDSSKPPLWAFLSTQFFYKVWENLPPYRPGNPTIDDMLFTKYRHDDPLIQSLWKMQADRDKKIELYVHNTRERIDGLIAHLEAQDDKSSGLSNGLPPVAPQLANLDHNLRSFAEELALPNSPISIEVNSTSDDNFAYVALMRAALPADQSLQVLVKKTDIDVYAARFTGKDIRFTDNQNLAQLKNTTFVVAPGQSINRKLFDQVGIVWKPLEEWLKVPITKEKLETILKAAIAAWKSA